MKIQDYYLRQSLARRLWICYILTPQTLYLSSPPANGEVKNLQTAKYSINPCVSNYPNEFAAIILPPRAGNHY